jgi:hypothetical protein
MKIYQVKIELFESKPKIWRRLFVQNDTLLSDFHKIIQTVMGWTNSHLHQFIKNNTFYTRKWKDDDFWDDLNNVDYKNFKISDLLKQEGEQIIYEYDFGDGWQHNIILENILLSEDETQYPICIDGKMNCPPEDCGGIWGYSNILKLLNQPDNPEHENIIDWLGEEFDPEFFDKDEVNRRLLKKDYGCFEL